MPVLIATTNHGKIREIQRALDGTGLTFVTLADRPALPEPEETGATFAENAWIKASAYAAATGLATLAEDSGLAIDALGGRPGVLSARYPGATYPDKFSNLYAELEGQPQPWTGRFVSAIALASPGADRPVFTAEGVSAGVIVRPPRGTRGFGYDPIFEYGTTGRTGGELTDTEKLAVSHRGRALEQFRRWLETSGFSG